MANKLGFGLMRLPQDDPNDATSINQEKVNEMVDVFMEKGGTHFDTAYVYHGGQSETVFKNAVTLRYPREAFTVTDKMPMFMISKKEQLAKIFDEQLERLGVTYIDYYWLHALGKKTFELSEEIQAFEFIDQKKKRIKLNLRDFLSMINQKC